jgi:hypothetical protein
MFRNEPPAGVLRTCLERRRAMTTQAYASGRQAPQVCSGRERI